MAIQLTERAAKQIKRSLEKRGKGLGLRLGIKKVGCSGLAYTFDYADDIGDGDQLFEAHEVKVVVDGEALKVIDGSTLDFVREGLKESFKFDNPNAKSQCGCGESFNV
ncbi:MAG: iron-sulfur cluster assembly accessory protein [Betaproteobacteria bacterium]|nr:iron-sulfur cluster assembly accessory protein [Betaproteobacteria bacterium]